MSKRIDELLAAEGAAAEGFEEDQSTPYPENVKISRGNPRSKVLQVRLTPDEFAALEQIADERKLPASTVAREHLLKLIADQSRGGGDVSPAVTLIAALEQFEAISSQFRHTIAESFRSHESEFESQFETGRAYLSHCQQGTLRMLGLDASEMGGLIAECRDRPAAETEAAEAADQR